VVRSVREFRAKDPDLVDEFSNDFGAHRVLTSEAVGAVQQL
jgi:hypothetical protein